MRWMDELAKYMEVQVYHIGVYEKSTNMAYINYQTKRAKVKNVGKNLGRFRIFDVKQVDINSDDIIFLDGYGFIAQHIMALCLILSCKKYGITVDGGFFPKKENIIKYFIKKFIISHASFYFSTCEDMDRLLVYYGAKKENIHRHNFSNYYEAEILELCHLKTFEDEKKKLYAELGFSKGFTPFLLISVGKLISSKGFDMLSEALDKLDARSERWEDEKKKKWEHAKCFIIGGDRGAEQEMLDFKFNSKIIFLPFMGKEELRKYYQIADVFVLPTRHDVWGLVIGEAMSCGLPVITTDMCLAGKAMIKEGENGYLVRVGDIEELADKIETIMEKDYFSMGIKSIEVAKKFAIDIVAKDDVAELKAYFTTK